MKGVTTKCQMKRLLDHSLILVHLEEKHVSNKGVVLWWLGD